jgi:ParB family chromosome partitioning protein
MAAAKKRGLGRGLDALLGGDGDASPSVIGQEGELRMLPIQQIQPGKYQPRRHWNDEALDELAASIKAQGLIQPVVVRAIRQEQLRADRRRAPLARGAARPAQPSCRRW